MKFGLFFAPSEETLYNGIMPIPPLTIGIISSYLRGKGHTVKPYDLNTDLYDLYANQTLTKTDMSFIFKKNEVLKYLNGEDVPEIDRFFEKLLANKPLDSFQAAGISIGGTFFWMPIHGGILLARYIKKKYKIPVIIGGNNILYLYMFTEVYQELWDALIRNFNFIIMGSAMNSLHKIIDRLEDNPNWKPTESEYNTFKGLVYKKDGDYCYVPRDQHVILKPDFHGLRLDYYMNFIRDPQKSPDSKKTERQNLEQLFKWDHFVLQNANKTFRKAKKDGFIKKLIIPYVFNYHCPHKCAFCAESNSGQKVVLGDPIQVVNDIEELLNEYNTEYVYFYNNYFNLSKKFVLTFTEEVKRRKLKFYWKDCARFDNIDFNLLNEMKKSGCQTLWFGMETGGEKILKLLNKKLNMKIIKDGLDLSMKVGIWANLEIIVGFPHETKDDFLKTVRFLKENADKINLFQNNRYFVVPNSMFCKYPEKYEIEIVKDIVTYDSLMRDNLNWFLSDEGMHKKPHNFHIYSFNELGGRKYKEVIESGIKRLRYIYRLQNKESDDIRQMLLLMDIINKQKKKSQKAQTVT